MNQPSAPVIDGRNCSLWLQPVVWAVTLFLLLNLGLTFSTSNILGKAPQDRSVVFQACNSAVDQFRQVRPSVVLMGSSVIMAPVWSVDAQRFSGVADVYHHHRSLLLQQLLSASTGKDIQVFTFALPGAMVSDGYLLTEKLLKGPHAPCVLVYGLAPRDLMDDLLTGETRTAVFQSLMTLSDLPRLGNLYLSSWPEKVDFVLNNVLFIYGKRARYQQKLNSILQNACAKLLPDCDAKATMGTEDKAARAFLLDANRKEIWSKSIAEYKARYKHFNAEQFDKQKHFLESTLSICKQRGIKVVLVNMPLTQDNLQLLEPGMYGRYLGSVKSLASRYDCTFLDPQQTSVYGDSCFYDTVHLNAQGGSKFLQELADSLHP